MNCPRCGTRLRRQFTLEGVELFWCDKCGRYVEYEEEGEDRIGGEEDNGTDSQ